MAPKPTTAKEWKSLADKIEASLPPTRQRIDQLLKKIESDALKEVEAVLFKTNPANISVLIILLWR
jgi:hypothetical protein